MLGGSMSNNEKILGMVQLNTFSQRLGYSLQRLNVNQSELAKCVCIRRQAIQYMVKAVNSKSKHCYHIAKALNVDPDWLILGIGDVEEAMPKNYDIPCFYKSENDDKH